MALASSLLDICGTRRRIIRHLKLSLSGNYATGGDTLDLTATTNPNNLPAAKAFASLPSVIAVLNKPDGYTCEMIPGNALNNNLLKWYTAEGTELGAAAYPAALSGATDIVCEVVTGVNL